MLMVSVETVKLVPVELLFLKSALLELTGELLGQLSISIAHPVTSIDIVHTMELRKPGMRTILPVGIQSTGPFGQRALVNFAK